MSDKSSCADLYCYDNVPEPVIFAQGRKIIFSNIIKNAHIFMSNNNSPDNAINKFNKFQNNEKIVFAQTSYTHGCSCRNYEYHITMVTNFGKILILQNFNDGHRFNKYIDLDFMIPVDYIKILNELVNITFHAQGNVHSDRIINALKKMKEMLYSRQYKPLFVNDIDDENEKLKIENEKLKKEHEEFLIKKKYFEEKYGEFVKIDEEKQRLINILNFVSEEKQKLKIANEKIKEKELRINSFDIDQFLQ